jgi:hypothetical protein
VRPIFVLDPDGNTSSALESWNRSLQMFDAPNGGGQGGPDFGRGGHGGNPYSPNGVRHGNDSGQPGGSPGFTIEVSEDMCAEIAACSGGQGKRGPSRIWDAPIDAWAATAADIATDFVPGVAQAKTAYDAYDRIQNGEDPVDVLMAAGADAALGLIPGLKAGKKIDKALDKAEDVADAAGDVADASQKVGRGGTRLGPDLSAQGPHSTFKRDPTTGRVTGHAEWRPNSRNPHGYDQVKRVDVAGEAHFNKATQQDIHSPHVHEKGIPGGVRPARSDEIPR